jgi:hypothetical protein
VTDPVAPNDLDAEAALLGALMLGAPAPQGRAAADFYKPSHGRIFDAICSLADRGAPTEPLIVKGELDRTGQADGIVLGDLVALQAGALTVSSAGHYDAIVRSKAKDRRRLGALGDAASKIRAGRGDEATETLLAELDRPEPPRALTVRWVGEALATPQDDRPVLVEGMARAGEQIVLGAPRAIGKSWLAENLAVLGDRGEGYLGGALRVARRFKTLIAQGEVDEWESARRWRMLTGQERPPTHVAETFERWRLRIVRKRSTNGGQSQEWFDAVLDPRLEATIAEHGIDLLVIDPWAVYYAGAENSNDETEAALDKLRDLTMRYHLAVLILHHLGKATEGRDPEDLWRGASRLADWASTRITLLPHFSDQQAERQGMTRQQARRYVDVKFLRRSTPTDDFSMVLDGETGWWSRWAAPQDAAEGRRVHLGVPDVVDALNASGGTWPSTNSAAKDLGVAYETAVKLLGAAVRQGAIEPVNGGRRAQGYRVLGAVPSQPCLDGDK